MVSPSAIQQPGFGPGSAQSNFYGEVYAVRVKGLQDQMQSNLNGIANYTTTARFVELWTDTSAWVKGAQPFVVSGGKMYAPAGAAGGANGNHSFASAAGDPLRWSVSFTLPVAAGTGSLIIGFDSNAPGAVPSNGASSVSYGAEFNLAQTNGIRRYVNGNFLGNFAGTYPGGGEYTMHFISDANWLSYSLFNDGTNNEYIYGRTLRSGVTINNLYLYNSDSRQAAGGASVNPNGARAAIQPALAGQAGGQGQFSQYTGNDTTPTIGYHIWGPAGYDPRRPWPLVVLFHGDGSDENFFTTPALLPVKDALLNAGYLVAACGIAANKSTWGNQATINAYAGLYQYMLTNYTVGPVVMLAVSMGGIESLNCLASKKIPGVVAWVGLAPTANLATCYANPSFTTKINTAYGITGSGQTTYALATDGYDPLLQTDPHVFQDLPMMFLAATDDTLVPKAQNTDLLYAKVATTARERIDVPGITGGHSFSPTPYIPRIIEFINKYAIK